MEIQTAFAWIQVAVKQNLAHARINSLHSLLNCNYIWIQLHCKVRSSDKTTQAGNYNWNFVKRLAQSPVHQSVSFMYHPQRSILALIGWIGAIGSVARAWQNAKMSFRPWRTTAGRKVLKLTLLIPVL